MLTGSMVALVTPMTLVGDIDWQALQQLVEFHLESKTDVLVPVGTTGESATLSHQEHLEVIRRVVDQVAKRIPVMAGTGSNSTQEAIDLTQAAKEAGADACLLVTPYYNKPTQQGLVAHYKAIADAVSIPQVLYNVPGRTMCDLLPETVEKIWHHPNVVGIKEATGDIGRAKVLLAKAPSGFSILSGDDATAVELMLAGGHGNISVAANVAPKMMKLCCDAAIRKQASQARAYAERLQGLNQVLFVESNPIPVKWALHRMGMIQNGMRLPLTWLSVENEAVIERAMTQVGIL